MKKLSEKKYWESIFAAQETGPLSEGRAGALSGPKALAKRLLGPRVLGIFESYADYLLWNDIYPRYLPLGKNLKAVEIGSAPGDFMVKLWRRRGYQPYGIEYTENGVLLNRGAFLANGIPIENVIQDDFLSDELQQRLANSFDIVISRGFIEHFEDARYIVDLHVNLLAVGGTLVISIPRFRGINYALMSFFNRDNLDIHNLSIMDTSAFCQLFDNAHLEKKYCGCFGTLNLKLFNTKQNSLKRHLLKVCDFVQFGFNGLLWVLLRKRGLENRLTSPYLLYIGVRKA